MNYSPREHWRITLLVVLVLAATFALFSPTLAPTQEIGGEDGSTAQGVTNLQYGLDLAGGTRIRAPLVGLTAEDADFGGDSEAAVAATVAGELDGVDETEVIARERPEEANTVEVVDPNVTDEQFAAAMDAAGYSHDGVRDGVTAETRAEAVNVIEGKVNEAGLSGASVREVTTATGEHFILVEVPGEGRADVIELLEDRGSVRIDIYYPTDDGEYTTERAVLTQEDFQQVGTAQQDDQQGPHVPVTIRDSTAEEFQDAVVETGVAGPQGSRCTYFQDPDDTEPCLLLVVDDEVVNAFGMHPSLAQSMRSGDWARDPGFVLTTTDYAEAQHVSVNLRAGALPAPMDIGPDGSGSSSFISPSQGENFRTYSLAVGIIAVFAVSGTVFVRYREPRVALPMILTALAEVYALLGFAAAVGYPLDLAVIAGFIAVIGTGVDDLIIIADEVMAEGNVRSRKVFDSRFRRAFWVIGAAAATTIVAMSPLAVLSLGDLRGFAIFTILGVIVGVLVTRPAYGDILRLLLTDR